jgi:CRP-like cAMP-binding protein
LTELQLTALAAIGELACIAQDQVIFGCGERARYFYLLLSGTVSLELQTPVYTVCIQQLDSGQAFGWSALVDEPYRTFQVRARETCSVIRLPGDRLLEACQADDRLGSILFRQLAALVARRLRAAESRFTEFCGKGTEIRTPF